MRLVNCIALFCLAAGLQAFAQPCEPIPGAEQLWARPNLHWLFVGEMHGSNETSVAYYDLVCDALAHGRKVTVALERPSSEQETLGSILEGKDLEAAEKRLLQQPGWQTGEDGRTSKAMLRLLLALRELHAQQPSLKIAAFDAPTSESGPGARDASLGHTLLSIGQAEPDRLVLILVGNIHAMQHRMFGYDVAAMYIPAEQRVSLEVTDRGGDSWVTMNDLCGPAKNANVVDKNLTRPRGIYLDPSLAPFGKVDGILALAASLTPSEPAAGDADPLPACRQKYIEKNK